MRGRVPRVSRKPPVRPMKRRRYPSELPPRQPDRSIALFPLGLVGFVLTLSLILILVVTVRGPDTHTNLWNEVREGYTRTGVEYVVSLPGPPVPPLEKPTPVPPPTLAPGSTPGSQPTPGTSPSPAPSPTAPPARVEVSFSRDVLPVLKANCAACHGLGVSLKGVSVISYQALTDTKAHAPLFVHGKPEESLLMDVLRGRKTPMPPSGPLPEEQIKAIEEWIRQGGQDN